MDFDNNIYDIGGRKPFTQGWNQNMNTAYALPIKKSGKVVQVYKSLSDQKVNKDDDEDDEVDETSYDNDYNVGADDEFNQEDEYEDFNQIKAKKSPKVETKVNKKNKCLPVSTKPLSINGFEKIKIMIAEICTTICADPPQGLKRKAKEETESKNNHKSSTGKTKANTNAYRLSDLFELINHNDMRVKEIAILSTLLVFKDIMPGYQIREQNEIDSSIKLKKDTKQVLDFEQSLLRAYHRFLNLLDAFITEGLGNPKLNATIATNHNNNNDDGDDDENDEQVSIFNWNDPVKMLGFNALKCQCELLRSVPHFNLRPQLIASIVSRAAQAVEKISNLCCEYLIKTIETDVEGEYSYEIVRAIASLLIATKHEVPEGMLYVLEKVKVRIHEDEAKGIRKQAKKDRRKRKRDTDDVEARMLEATGINPVTVKRRQADSLKELVLIYFRILKNKVGFKLLPVALEGLARLTHLINMDTVMDLLGVLKRLLECTAPLTPVAVRLHCVFCALRTLTGPGEELEMDDEVFVSGLCTIMTDLLISTNNHSQQQQQQQQQRWDLVLECVELCLIKKRETRKHYILDILKLLFLHSCIITPSAAVVTLSLAHCVLIHYPTIRAEVMSGLSRIQRGEMSEQEEKVEDFAMSALIQRNLASHDKIRSHGNTEEHIFWALALLRHSPFQRLVDVCKILSGNNIMPIQYNLNDAKPLNDIQLLDDIDMSIASTASTNMHKKTASSSSKNNNNNNNQNNKRTTKGSRFSTKDKNKNGNSDGHNKTKQQSNNNKMKTKTAIQFKSLKPVDGNETYNTVHNSTATHHQIKKKIDFSSKLKNSSNNNSNSNDNNNGYNNNKNFNSSSSTSSSSFKTGKKSSSFKTGKKSSSSSSSSLTANTTNGYKGKSTSPAPSKNHSKSIIGNNGKNNNNKSGKSKSTHGGEMSMKNGRSPVGKDSRVNGGSKSTNNSQVKRKSDTKDSKSKKAKY